MPSRSTLPETDPLEQLGIGGAAPAKQQLVLAKANGKPKAGQVANIEPPRSAPQLKAQPQAKTPEQSRVEAAAVVSGKQKLNCRIPVELADSIRDCVVALSGPPLGLTVDAFAEEAFRREVDRLQCLSNSGERFPARPYNPRPGRRVR